jgi:hypothetical protein
MLVLEEGPELALWVKIPVNVPLSWLKAAIIWVSFCPRPPKKIKYNKLIANIYNYIILIMQIGETKQKLTLFFWD